jgi:imidazole glycerol-phosphate synthase subunit HisH
MYIAIIDYNMGNIKSVENAFKRIGADVKVTDKPEIISGAKAVVLPGVGAFRDAIGNLKKLGLYECIMNTIAQDKPFLGICIGLQVLFEYGMEGAKSPGLGIFKGSVEKIPDGVKIPHMGWNKIRIIKKDSRLFKGIVSGESFYFVHSYHAVCADEEIISSTTDYGIDIVSSIEKGNSYALQFHPEKSSAFGLKVLRNFMEIASL